MNLKKKAASGMVWTAFQRYSTMIVQFISGIILARLLTPFDYGCIGMLSIFMVLSESFIDGGFGSALIQKKNPTQEDYSTIFFWNLGMAAVMYAILYVSAPAIARFYNIPLLCKVLRVQALVLFIYAFNIIQKNQLKKRLDFKRISIITIITSVTSLTVTIIMAVKGCGVWALVVQNLITAAIPAFVYWFYVKWRPVLIFSWDSFRELFSFGFYMFLTHIFNDFSKQIQGLLIGKVYDASTMGYYSKALSTEKLAATSISNVITQVTYPLYAQVQNDKSAIGNMVKRISSTVAFLTAPLLMVLCVCAKPAFVLLYSERWLASVPYFQVLCFQGITLCLQSVNFQAIAAIGKSRTMFHWTFIKRTVGLVFIVGGLAVWGMKGLLCGVILNSWFSYLVNIILVSKHIGYSWKSQLADVLPSVIMAVFAAAVCFGMGKLFNLSLYVDGAVKFVLFVSIYLGWAFMAKPESYKYVISMLPGKFRFWERKA